ncbi:MAG: flagellar hook-length control protein FliK [Candidatus Accumulibacter sp.]|jgi:flagellar hook-length control protein FliK|nr:flagellar hook-length control protein FliK [Accumulibacter sp.]
MSITIVSSTAAPSPANTPSATGSGGGGVLDFAGLFFEQLFGAEAPPLSADDAREDSARTPFSDVVSDDPLLFAEAAIPLVASEIRLTPETPLPDATPRADEVSRVDSSAPTSVMDALRAVSGSFVQRQSEQRSDDADPEKAFPAAFSIENTAATTARAAKIADSPSALAQIGAGMSAEPKEPMESTTIRADAANTSIAANSALPIPASVTNASNANAKAAELSQAEVRTPVGNSAWADDFNQKIVWLAKNDAQSAQITLNPPQLGPIEVSLNLDKGNATAFFVSANSEVRESIETAIPRLREMLAGAGIELGQAHVGAESFRQPTRENAPDLSRWMGDEAILAESPTARTRGVALRSGNGLVDTFA